MKGLVLEYLTHNNSRASAKKFPEGSNRKDKNKKRAIAHQESLSSCGRLGDALDNCPGLNLKNILHHEPRIKVKTFSKETPIFEKNAYF